MAKEDLRREIDEIDSKIVEFLNKRAEIALKIGDLKKNNNTPVYDPVREQKVLDRITTQNKGPQKDECLKAIYREIMSGCRQLEMEPRVSYLGPEWTFSYIAVKQKFGSSVKYIASRGIADVFRDVATGRSDYGIVPVENTTDGGIRETLNMFVEYDVKVCAEVVLPIHHNLMANCTKDHVKKVYSKPQILVQCNNWLAMNLPHIELIEVSSSAEAARIVRDTQSTHEKDHGLAAIGNAELAPQYRLNILCQNIEDNENNITRFFVLGKEDVAPSGKDKTALMCYIRNCPGALMEILEPFKTYKINLRNIESLPTRRKAWENCFYLDFDEHVSSDAVQNALKELSDKCFEVKILGSFPKGE